MNEPVAWMDKESGVVCKEVYATEMPNNLIPLYTHPVKELTDEEIKAKYEADYAKAFENGYAIGLSHGKDLANNG